MHTEAVTETITDYSAVLTPKQVKGYVEAQRERGLVEFNNGSILVKSKHPVDQLLKRSMIEQEHYDVAKAFMTLRDCAFGGMQGRIYNGLGEGDSGIDAATLYAHTWRKLTKNQWEIVKIVCFPEPRLDGEYFSEADYQMLYKLAPNIQSALEALNTAMVEARKEIKERINDGN
jgi:hypothetical protein